MINKKIKLLLGVVFAMMFCLSSSLCSDTNSSKDGNETELNSSAIADINSSKLFQKRFVFFDRSLAEDRYFELAQKVILDAEALGFNGFVLNEEYIYSRLSHDNAILNKAKENMALLSTMAHEHGLDLIVMHFSAEVPNTIVHDNDQNNTFYQEGKFDFSEANKAVTIYTVKGDRAEVNGSKEVQTSRGFLDRLYHFENIKPNTEYRITMNATTDAFMGKDVKVSVLDEDHNGENGKVIFGIHKYFKDIEPSKENGEYSIYFNSLNHKNLNGKIKIYIGYSGEGSIDVNSITLQEVGYTKSEHVVRPDTLPIVRAMADENGTVYEAGVDYTLDDSGLILLSEQIKAESALRVTWYPKINTSLPYDHETTADICADEALYYTIMIDQYQTIKHILGDQIEGIAFNDDEWREAGWDASCEELYAKEYNTSNVTGGFTAGDYIGISTQRTIDKLLADENKSTMKSYLMSDMFDPNFNAKDPYMGTNGGAEGATEYLNPEDVVMFNWFPNPYEPGLEDKTMDDFLASAKYFADRNISQIISGYHDDMRNLDSNFAFYNDSSKEVQKSIIGFMFLIWHRPDKSASYDDMDDVVARICQELPGKWPQDVCDALEQ
jgi:hypothetical protein